MSDVTVHYEGPVISRKDAKAQGLKTYFTGEACPNGHMAERYVSTRACLVCNKERYVPKGQPKTRPWAIKEIVDYTGAIVTRKVAKAAGQRKYFTGKPCDRGHLSQRNADSGSCLNCAALQRRGTITEIERISKATQKKIARTDAIKERNAKASIHYSGEIVLRREAAKRGMPMYYTGVSCDNGHIAERYTKSGHCLICDRATARRYIANNKNTIGARRKIYRKLHPEKFAVRNGNRRARKRGAHGKYTIDDVNKILLLQSRKCANCFVRVHKKFHVDHRIPLALGGSNAPSNIQILCPTCNLRKNAKDPITFAQEQGRLL